MAGRAQEGRRIMLNDPVSIFQIEGEVVSVHEYGEGHINTTHKVVMADGSEYLLQSINTNIFKNPDELMENIQNVTEYLRKVIALRGGDPSRETLEVIPTRENHLYYRDEEGTCWRMYHFIRNTVTYQSFEDPAIFEKCGKAFGQFLADLDEYPADSLHEAIPDFHHTVKRYRTLQAAIADDVCGRAADVQEEIAFAAAREDRYGMILDALESGEMPLRVTHNDTKVNNVLMDAVTGDGICVIDLDTVMPGSCLYDFGDAIRFGAATAAEDCTELDTMKMDVALFEAFARGFITGTQGKLTPMEIKMLPVGAWMMTMENGIRFLTDHLSGDVYFKIHHSGHNLERCRAQFALAADMESKMEKLVELVQKI
ncbi:MAG: aminoglycoside phosphotransferase family protein [Firmicutes bacterium]|nr:aminoglycoside phosphotransferase family protein [Bacillota bacterium]